MSFWATKFIFDGIVSDSYGLLCGKMGASGEESSSSGSSVEIMEDYIPKRTKPYFYGVKFSEKLEFQLDIFGENTIDRYLVQAIEQWLFGNRSYKKLQLLQCDMYDTYFNCIITKAQTIGVGNEVRGFSCNIICDSPWGWGKKITKKITSSLVDQTIEVVNSSDDSSYLYPVISFYSSEQQSGVRIINTSDQDRETNFSYLISGERITIDNDIKLVESDKDGIYDRFNGVYFRLLRGRNMIRFVGNLEDISISYVPARKVGS